MGEIKNGVPQSGVLYPTLFLIFMNDLKKQMTKNVQSVQAMQMIWPWSTLKIQVAHPRSAYKAHLTTCSHGATPGD